MELVFAAAGALRKVYINGRKVSLLGVETNFTPMTIDLDKLDSPESKKAMEKMGIVGEERRLIDEIVLLGTEKEIAKDIIKDFQSTGWRLVKK